MLHIFIDKNYFGEQLKPNWLKREDKRRRQELDTVKSEGQTLRRVQCLCISRVSNTMFSKNTSNDFTKSNISECISYNSSGGSRVKSST